MNFSLVLLKNKNSGWYTKTEEKLSPKIIFCSILRGKNANFFFRYIAVNGNTKLEFLS